MFMAFMWLCVCIAGGVAAGSVEFMQTTLTAAATDTDTTLYLRTTEGLPSCGVVTIEDENIAYGAKTATTLTGTLASPLTCGAQDTTAAAHAAGTAVTTVPGSLINLSAEYSVATITDTSGIQAFIAAPRPSSGC